MILRQRLLHPLFMLLAVLLVVGPVSAMPGIFVGKRDAKRIVHATHIVLMKGPQRSVVTVMVDYDGPFEPFAFVMPVPADVTVDRLTTLKRDAVDRVEKLSAPRVHHFWEKDPCALGKARQVWERHLKVKQGSGVQMFGGMLDFSGGRRKVPRELSWAVEPEYKTGEYTYTILPSAVAESEEGEDQAQDAKQRDKKEKAKQDKKRKAKKGKDGKEREDEEEAPPPPPATELAAWLKGRGYQLPPAAQKALAPYIDAGMAVLVAEVNPEKVELIGGDRAQLSPIRYWTREVVKKFPVTLGLLHLDQAQELFVYVVHPTARFDIANYNNIFPPTNIEIRERLEKIWVQERIGEIYAAIHDRLAAKHPKSFVSEYAWDIETCGEPCPNEPLLLYELMGLGGELIDLDLPEEQRNPEPPELTEREEEMFEAELEELEPKDRKDFKKAREKERWEVARRKALAARHKYVLSRSHARYDRKFLTKDVEIKSAKPVAGGEQLPKGENGTLPRSVRPAKKNKYQIRFVTLHPWLGIVECEKPVRWRWGEEWFSVRRLNKIWIAEDLTRKQRGRTKLEDVIISPVPEIGVAGGPRDVPDAGAEAGAEPAEEVEESGCGCRLGRAGSAPGARWAALVGLLAAARRLRGRRRRRPNPDRAPVDR